MPEIGLADVYDAMLYEEIPCKKAVNKYRIFHQKQNTEMKNTFFFVWNLNPRQLGSILHSTRNLLQGLLAGAQENQEQTAELEYGPQNLLKNC